MFTNHGFVSIIVCGHDNRVFVNHDVVSLAFDSIKSYGGSRSSTGNSNEADEIPINVYYLGTCNLCFNFFEQIICF